jgi:hypothetical protein
MSFGPASPDVRLSLGFDVDMDGEFDVDFQLELKMECKLIDTSKRCVSCSLCNKQEIERSENVLASDSVTLP